MKRARRIIIGVIVAGGVISILLNNRAHINAKSRNDFQAAIPVSVVDVKSERHSETLSLVGTIMAENDVAIVAETGGKVKEIFAKVGDYREAGSPLIQVDDEIKKADFERAQVNYDRAKKDMERYASLRNEQAATEIQKDNAYQAFKVAEAQYIVARRQLRDTKISTPISGVVTARNVDLGSMVTDKMVVANVVDISHLKVKLNVSEFDAFKLKAGDRVEVSTDVYPGVTFDGKITSISAKADEGHTYPVEIMLENNKTHPLRAGMFGRVDFVSITATEALAIPRKSLVGSMKAPQVFVVENGLARKRDIVVGSAVGTDLLVLGGLHTGETVVVNGQNNLKDSVSVDILK
jgi:RND family efflux transporter MFP subunit